MSELERLKGQVKFLENALEQATEFFDIEGASDGVDRISLILRSKDSTVGTWWNEDKKPELAQYLWARKLVESDV